MNAVPSRQWRQPRCTVFGKPSIIYDETRIAMRLEQARIYRDISATELGCRVGIDRK